jgi:hypothetical protein
MSTTRRVVLAAGGLALGLVGSGAVFAVTRVPKNALAPWQGLDAPEPDVRLDAFRHAILAPNPHNRQPWVIELVGDSEAVIRCDLDKRLPETDPFDRQITIGFGCFLELARIAACQRGHRIVVEAFPQGAPELPQRLDHRPIARLGFVRDPDVRTDALYAAIRIRRSSKVPFDATRVVTTQTTDAVRAAAGDSRLGFTTEPDAVKSLRSLTWDAWMVEARTSRTFKESVDLMRIGKAEIEANPDGIALRGAMIEALAMVGQLSRASMLDPASAGFKAGVDKYRPIMDTASSYAWLTTAGNTRRDHLEAGQRYVRFNLAANAAGLAVHPVSQALQEFAEMADVHARMRKTLGVDAADTLQMLARIGYAESIEPSPRWPLKTKVIRT